MVGAVGAEGAGVADWRALLARWRPGAVIAAGTFAAASIYIFTIPASFRASLQILLPVSEIEDPGERKSLPMAQTDVFLVHSYTDIAKDEELARRVIGDLRLSDEPDFNRPPDVVDRAVDAVRRVLVRPDTPSPSQARAIKEDAVLRAYKARLSAVNDSKSLTLTLSFDAGDPRLASRASRIVNAHAQTLLLEQVERRRDEAKVRLAWMKSELDAAAEEMRAAQNAVQLHPSDVASSRAAAEQVSDFRYLTTLAASKQSIYENMLIRYQAALADERYQGSSIRVLSLAEPPVHPDSPKRALLLGVAAVLALAAGVLASVVAMVSRGETRADAARRIGLAALGTVNLPRRTFLLPIGRMRRAYFWDQISGVRGALRLAKPRGNAVAIVSLSGGEGKSLVGAALARALAVGGAKTILIDADIRRSRFHPPPGCPDLLDVLDGTVAMAKAVMPVDAALPFFLLPGCDRPVDAALLSGPKMKAMMKAVRKQYHFALLDTSAFDTFPDALAIADVVDGVILVASGALPAAPFLALVGKLTARGAVLHGVVFTSRRRPPRSLLSALRTYASHVNPPALWPQPDAEREADPSAEQPAQARPCLPSIAASPSLNLEA